MTKIASLRLTDKVQFGLEMKLSVWTSLVTFTFLACLESLVNSVPAPSPSPQFPFTVLTTKSKGHRKTYRSNQDNSQGFSFFRLLINKFFQFSQPQHHYEDVGFEPAGFDSYSLDDVYIPYEHGPPFIHE
ncbi:CLUMA_CG003467, isoform A [Clunio marinus]|uniref:CLUMA_CG003467, isoform A n=1 Tax=Clunio marinus TaxID=568069 RepID=A0A1J1HU85_9DIPT|nr:CLUMA_CG003467, isoform A [Clunio marinus]